QQITCTPLARKSGTYHVRVLNPDGQIALLKSAYTYRPDPPLVDHGVAARFSSAWGTFATTGQSGRNRVSVWLSDHRGCDSILSVDVESGENSMVYLPAPRGKQAPTRSLLSERGKIYALFGGRFFEFDPDTQQLSFQQEIQTENQPVYYWETAMGMTESSDGMIWAVTWPYSHLYSFNPVTKQLSSYGSANKEQWHQYPGYIATDSSGWIYIGIGTSLSQVVAFNPETAAPGGNSTFLPLLSSSERVPGSAFVYTDMDGNVYGLAEGGQRTGWFRFSNGQKTALTGNPPNRRKLIRTGFQDFVINHFRDGSTLTQLDLIEKKLVVTSAQGSQKTIPLRYETEGGAIVSLTATAFGSICGSAAFPMRLFCFSPQAMGWNSRATAHQANVFAVEGSEIFFGSYPEGSLSQWRPTSQSIGEPTSLVPSSSFSLLRRPHELLVTPDRNSLILAGTPGYGLTGGGLVIWNRTTGAKKEIPHTALLAHHSTMSLVTLPDGRIIGGSTIRAGTGGVNLAPEAELYQFDPVAERVIWRQVVIPKVHTYAELISTADNKVLGIADGR
ncbi:hypothetical protein EBR78_10550, partial [bacterium]|nr:hypothetical protein [bacterium]